MKKPSASSARNAMVIFAVLAIVFVAQMSWWIIFQVRTAGSTKKFLATTLQDERRWIIDLLNSRYKAIYNSAEKATGEPVGAFSAKALLSDRAVSGVTAENEMAKPIPADSLYFMVSGESGRILIFLNRSYPQIMLSGSQSLEFVTTAKGELPGPEWITENDVQIKPSSFADLDAQRNKHLKMFIMEGSFFILLILIGAYMIYAALRRSRQIREEQLLFVHSITHELKIPITAVSLFLDTIKRRNYDSQLVSQLAPKMKQDLVRLNQLIDNILQVRKLSDKDIGTKLTLIDLSSELSRFAHDMTARIDGSGGKLKLNIEDNIRVNASLQDLPKVWELLVDNALKYGPAGTLELQINLVRHKGQAEIQFLDNGPGIPKGMEEKLFEPFFRGHIENKKSVPGSGLGLYIAREYVRRSGGSISIRNRPEGGCAVTLKLKTVK